MNFWPTGISLPFSQMILFSDLLIKLIDLKSIITLALSTALIWGFVVNRIDAKDFLVYVTLVLTFYFAKKDDKTESVIEDTTKGVG